MHYSLKERPMSPTPATTHSGLSMTSPLSTNVNIGSPVAPCAPFRTTNPVSYLTTSRSNLIINKLNIFMHYLFQHIRFKLKLSNCNCCINLSK